jgi:hypothetical protein
MSYYDRNSNWGKVRRTETGAVLCRSMQLHPQLEETPDISRGQQRLAAEVALTRLKGFPVPTDVEAVARSILQVLAKG